MGIEKNIGKLGIVIVKLCFIEINCLLSYLFVVCLCEGEFFDFLDFYI